MKIILLTGTLFVLFAVSCASTMPEKSNPAASRGQERPLKLDSKLIQPGYALYGVFEARMPVAENAYLLAKRGESQATIRDTAGLVQIVSGIASKEDALAFVRLITSPELRPFLHDVYYSEVHAKTDAQDQWFAVAAEQYAQWQLHDPLVTEANGKYKIERFVACYPRLLTQNQQKKLTPAQLVKIWEWVDAQGNYAAEIKDVLAEGGDIQKMLLFTK